jgi:hypothetical protein
MNTTSLPVVKLWRKIKKDLVACRWHSRSFELWTISVECEILVPALRMFVHPPGNPGMAHLPFGCGSCTNGSAPRLAPASPLRRSNLTDKFLSFCRQGGGVCPSSARISLRACGERAPGIGVCQFLVLARHTPQGANSTRWGEVRVAPVGTYQSSGATAAASAGASCRTRRWSTPTRVSTWAAPRAETRRVCGALRGTAFRALSAAISLPVVLPARNALHLRLQFPNSQCSPALRGKAFSGSGTRRWVFPAKKPHRKERAVISCRTSARWRL